MKKIFFILFAGFLLSCQQNTNDRKPYVIEITTFAYKTSVNIDEFWKEDANIQAKFTSKQPGFISRESGYSKENNEVLVVVKWKNQTSADASMQKFMTDTSVTTYADMIDAPSMKMKRYQVK
ncbi:hypothetical protein [uncultured Dokdonia sp.]|uniref:hypothetical protein n=1 Tax=uncultured Dokdonia sp. TaxID=575653 RepID=UPI002621F3CA|nr:hypothetical protein [uncultured Dokdonia sp.]